MNSLGQTPVSVEKGINASAREWYAVRTRHRCERLSVEYLIRNSIETFLPVREELHVWSDRKKKLVLPLFPGYLFVCIILVESRLTVLRAPGVLKFVSFNGNVARIEPGQIEAVCLLTRHKVPCWIGRSTLALGTRVRIQGVPWMGLRGR